MFRRASVLLFLVALLAVASCSSFKSKKRLNLGPFAEDMIAVAGDIQYGLGESRPVLIRSYLETPEAHELDIGLRKIRAVVRACISYAVQVVTLAESRLSGPEQAAALADYLDGLLRPVLDRPAPELNMTVEKLDHLVADVRSQTKLLDALAAAQPVVDEIAYSAGELFDETKDLMDRTVDAARHGIESDNESVLQGDRTLKSFLVGAMEDVALIRAHRVGDPHAMDSLVARQPSIREIVDPDDGISYEEMRAIEDRLMFLLRSLRELRDQLQPDIELYWEQQRELDHIANKYNAALRQATVAVLAWSRAHKRLAAGVTDPAEIDVLGIAKKAAGSANPLPF
jgi:hypothetical protein